MKTNILLSLIILFLTNYMHSQDKSFKNTSIDFVIKKRHLVSSKYTDAENNKEHGGTWDGNMPIGTPPPPPLPKEVTSNYKGFKYFNITPTQYVIYNTNYNDFESDTLYNAVLNILKIDRLDHSVTNFNLYNFTLRKEELYRSNYCDYDVITEDRNDIKVIAGYNCFKVTLKNERQPDLSIDMYVTTEISLDYHPIINCETVLENYYPLYFKEYKNKYPDDYFTEYTFVKAQ
ncbi:hypothetical protein BXY82_0607 [Gelidibacter sediminis]|uniref:GLPGLI family protein n=1 Tax=Gelidibacter sediminis TaxID=1608710 RepID=A0A4R7Q8G6_9FLAO|nr:hypothetical protein BXY82_0607 [Gelidibacter sediminis]